ncbi:protein S100-A1 isoform X1 [Nematolebias whitei]|uniref:protein S100-A1 isoform X1 n=2 Tax=Nematolebias whitei TaxID=451745 RepID=UPI0018976C39|nr:protein S100-A1 isoform X1 [Nematolebias whitei]
MMSSCFFSRRSEMCSPLQNAVEDMIKIFYSYSAKEGDKYKLNKKELKDLLEKELPAFFNGTNDSSLVEKLLLDLDDNKDGEVDFEEFVNLVAALAVASNEFFVDYVKEEDLKKAEDHKECGDGHKRD